MHTLDSLLKNCYELASGIVIGKKQGDQLTAEIILRNVEDGLTVIGCDWADFPSKREMVLAVGLQIIESRPKVDSFAFLSECWTASLKPGEKRTFDKPENAPNRQEAIICIVSDGTKQVFKSWTMVRDAQAKCVALVELSDALKFESWIIKILEAALDYRRMMP